MSLYMDGVTECSICHKKIFNKDDDWFCAPHFMQDMSHELWEYSGAFFHYDCYEKWEKKKQFEILFDNFIKINPSFPIKKIISTEKEGGLCDEEIDMILNDLKSGNSK